MINTGKRLSDVKSDFPVKISDYRISWTNTKEDLKEWDEFLKNNTRGHCQQVSHWLSSFKIYSLDFELLLIKNSNSEIIGGLGVVIVGVSIFKVLVAPSGPILSNGYEGLFESVLELFLERAKTKKVFYCHINVPVLREDDRFLAEYCLSNISNESLLFSGNEGNEFVHVYGIDGLRPVYIKYDEDLLPYEYVISKCNANTRRNIRAAYKNKLELRYATTEADVKDAYYVIERNAKLQGYDVRSWDDSKEMIMNMIQSDLCLVPCAYTDGVLKGSLILFDIGQRLTYIYGGIIREEKDLKLGHFMHNEMIKLSIEKGYKFYDISVNGSEGVTRFKKGFNGNHIEFIGNRYWVLNKMKFFIYKKFNPLIIRNKFLIARILKWRVFNS
jgi:lipid II:glycine glycyltransferase (peptidoglycan interpeptide bridge formation enzyme)